MPLTNSMAPDPRPSRSMAAATGPSSGRLPTTTRCASGFSVRALASASTRWIKPLRGTSGVDAEVVDDLLAGGSGDGQDGRQAAGDALLHTGESVPAADGGAALEAGGG